jgi:hypothetical protein
MSKKLILPSLSVSLCLLISYISEGQNMIDNVFVNWNKASLQSVARQKAAAKDSMIRSKYENRLEVMQVALGVGDEQKVKEQSIRYEFLVKIAPFLNLKKSNVFIIEANANTYTLLIRSFLIAVDSNNRATVYVYTHGKNDWQLQQTCVINNIRFEEDLKTYNTQYGKGFNGDDVIITRMKDGQVLESEYFINFTVSKKSLFKDIFACNGMTIR